MEIADGKFDKIAKYGAAAAVGYVAWTKTATAKFGNYQSASAPPLFSLQRFCDSLIGIVGNQAANQIANAINPDQGSRGFGNLGGQQAINPFGFINGTVMAGAAAYIANSVLKSTVKQYKSFPMVSDVLEGAALGAIIGGVIGGIFDPAPTNNTPAPTMPSNSGPNNLRTSSVISYTAS